MILREDLCAFVAALFLICLAHRAVGWCGKMLCLGVVHALTSWRAVMNFANACEQAFRQVQQLLEHKRLDSMSSEERAQMLRPQTDVYRAGGGYGRVASMGAASSSDEEEFEGAE